ncbi:hypothetical protein HU200_064447 [Digitaria exilis]|uniref:Uncharacterized protein n=1 Tax=Digitaria exilis TaxID=1010633 RepID=A0A835A5H9_9POAL|nr:hypothetical protein HU200_064447 [Digitaria exilis]
MAPSMKLSLLVPAILLILVVHVARYKTSSPPLDCLGPKCTASSVTVEQANTGEKAGYDPVFEVTVRNGCGCAVRGVYLRSEGFSSSVAVDPRLPPPPCAFRYAWDRAFRMTPAAVHDDWLLTPRADRSISGERAS